MNWVIPQLIAHRGASSEAPENTLSALRRAYELGATWVEFDVMSTQDGRLVIFHDERLERTTDGYGSVAESSYDDIRRLDAGSWFLDEFKDERIPTLKAWLACAADLGLGINLEIKGSKGQADVLAENILRVLDEYWRSDLPIPLISSTSKACLKAVRTRSPNAMLAYICGYYYFSQWQSVCRDLQCVSVHFNYLYLTARRVRKMKAKGLRVLAYTVNNTKLANKLLSWGVDGVFSNIANLLEDH